MSKVNLGLTCFKFYGANSAALLLPSMKVAGQVWHNMMTVLQFANGCAMLTQYQG